MLNYLQAADLGNVSLLRVTKAQRKEMLLETGEHMSHFTACLFAAILHWAVLP